MSKCLCFAQKIIFENSEYDMAFYYYYFHYLMKYNNTKDIERHYETILNAGDIYNDRTYF